MYCWLQFELLGVLAARRLRWSWSCTPSSPFAQFASESPVEELFYHQQCQYQLCVALSQLSAAVLCKKGELMLSAQQSCSCEQCPKSCVRSDEIIHFVFAVVSPSLCFDMFLSYYRCNPMFSHMLTCICMRSKKDGRNRARVTPASSLASPCSGEALTSPACRACGCASPFRTRFWSMPYGDNRGLQWYKQPFASFCTCRLFVLLCLFACGLSVCMLW